MAGESRQVKQQKGLGFDLLEDFLALIQSSISMKLKISNKIYSKSNKINHEKRNYQAYEARAAHNKEKDFQKKRKQFISVTSRTKGIN